MTRKTRHGFAPCQSCHAHFKTTDALCPFCGAPTHGRASEARPSGLQRILNVGRSGLIAASVLGLSAVPACVPSGNAPTGEDMGIQPAYGVPADVPILPPYGIPPEDAGPTADAEIHDAGPIDQPAYGIPAEPD